VSGFTEVADRIWVSRYPWLDVNVSVIAGEAGLLVLDTQASADLARGVVADLRRVSSLPVLWAVNSHEHWDHTFGNYLFEPATIVGHEATRTSIFDSGEPRSAPFWTEIDWGDIVLEPPFLTYTDSVTLWVDDLRADVRHVGTPAHTTNDSIVWLAERKVLYCGDLLFNGGTPFLAQGSVAGAIHVLEKVLSLDAPICW